MVRSDSAEQRLLEAIFSLETVAEVYSCVRGCTYTDDDGIEHPKDAKKGMLCGSCFWRILTRLAEAPKILVSLRSAMIPLGAGGLDERVDGTKDPGVPLREEAMDAADEFWDEVLRWAAENAGRLEQAGYSNLGTPPAVDRLLAIWRASGAPQERRLRLTPPRSLDSAARMMSDVCMWLRVHAEEIAHLDTIVEYHDGIVKAVGRARGQAGLVPPRRRAKARPCPVCMTTTVEVSSPDLGPMVARCTNCHMIVADPSAALIDMEGVAA